MENVSDQNCVFVSEDVTDWKISETVSTTYEIRDVYPQNGTEVYTVPFIHRAIVASILVVMACVGLFGNALVIISVVITKKLRTITNVLVVNLAIADILACTIIPFQSSALLSQTGRYPMPEVICATVAGVAYTSVCCSVSTLVAIAWVRWFVITRSIRGHQGVHTPKNIVILSVFLWIESAAFMVVPPLLGLGTLGYSEFYSICGITDNSPLGDYYAILQGALIVIALTMTFVFYTLILRHVLQHNKQFRDKFGADADTSSFSTQSQSSQNPSVSTISHDNRPPMIKAINKKEIEITKNLFTVVCVFVFCFVASSVNFAIPGSSVFTLYTTMILLGNSVVNPIIYGLKHPNFQEAFRNILFRRIK